MIGHVRNNLVSAINDYTLLLKFIIVMLEGDLLRAINHFKDAATVAYGPVILWLVSELHRIIVAHKEKLPTKARKFKFPKYYEFYLYSITNSQTTFTETNLLRYDISSHEI